MAISFEGTVAQIGCGSFTPNANTGTVVFWLNPSSVTGVRRSFGTNTNFEGRASGTTLFHDLGTDGPGELSTTIAINTWIHVAESYSNTGAGTTNTVVFYIDGASVASGTNTASAFVAGTLLLALRNGSSTTEHLAGQLDDFRIYNRVLSADEVNGIFVARGKDTITRGLLNRWTMLEGGPAANVTGTNGVKDKMGNNHGTGAGVTLPQYQQSRACTRRCRSGR